jgi:predicted aspartyl protease/Flp pilus assembly protein TadD
MRAAIRVFVVVGIVAAAPYMLIAGAQDPAGAEVQRQFGDLLFADGRYFEAADAYRRALGAPDAGARTAASAGLVRSLLRVADFGEALEQAVALRDGAPREAEAVALFGDALWSSGRFEEAEAAYRDALALDAQEPRARHGMARTLGARARPAEALAEAQAAVALAPRVAEFLHTVGAIFEKLRRYAEAANALESYVNLLPNKDRSERAAWTRAQIKFLRAFEGRPPLEFEGTLPDGPHTIPFKLVRDKIIVHGRVNGGRPVEFVLDTGAEQTVLSVDEARRAGVAPITYMQSAGVGEVGLRGLQVGRIDSLHLGTLRVKNVPCLIKNPPLGGLPTRESESFSPLALGMSLRLDYQQQTLTIGRNVAQGPYDVELPLRLHRLAMVQGLLNGTHPASFVVDTGGEVISISDATAGAIQPDPRMRRIPLRVYGSSGWDRDAFLLPGVDLQFDTIRFENIPVVVLNLRAPSALLGFQVGGIVGHKFLSKYRVSIDLERAVMGLNGQ